MDPDVAVKALRIVSARVQKDADAGRAIDADDAAMLADTFRDLDEWLSKGGFRPRVWHKEPEAF